MLEPSSGEIAQALSAAASKATALSRGNGWLYTWGAGEFGALGLGDMRDRAAPVVVDALRGKEVRWSVTLGCVHE